MIENKRFSTNGYYIYDGFKEDKWLVNEVEANRIVNMLNKLDTKARERSKALSTLQKKFNELKEENEELKKENQELREYLGWQDMELEEMEDWND